MATHSPITLPQLVELRRAIITNVRDLASDARTLHEAGRQPRAFALALLSAEEMAKLFGVDAVIRLMRAGQAPDWKQVWKELNKHDVKLALFMKLSQRSNAPPPQTFKTC